MTIIGQTLSKSLLARASVSAAIHGEFCVVRIAEAVAREWDDEEGLARGVQGAGEPEAAAMSITQLFDRQSAFDGPPGVAGIVASIDAAMVPSEDQICVIRIVSEGVNAVAFVGTVDALILGFEGLAAIVGAEDIGRRDADPDRTWRWDSR